MAKARGKKGKRGSSVPKTRKIHKKNGAPEPQRDIDQDIHVKLNEDILGLRETILKSNRGSQSQIDSIANAILLSLTNSTNASIREDIVLWTKQHLGSHLSNKLNAHMDKLKRRSTLIKPKYPILSAKKDKPAHPKQERSVKLKSGRLLKKSRGKGKDTYDQE